MIQVGWNIVKTVNHQGNLIDIGGHSILSKSEKCWIWWWNSSDFGLTTTTLKIGMVHSESQNLDNILQKNSEMPNASEEEEIQDYFNKRLWLSFEKKCSIAVRFGGFQISQN